MDVLQWSKESERIDDERIKNIDNTVMQFPGKNHNIS